MKYRNGVRSHRPSILSQSMAATRLWFAKEWERRIEDPCLNVVFATTLDSFRQQFLESGKPGTLDRTTLPSCTMILASMQPHTMPFMPWQMRTFGVKTGYLNNRQDAVVDRLTPVELGLGLRFRTANQDEAIAFATMWIENQPSVVIDLKNQKTGSVVQIGVLLEGQVSIPPANTASPGDLYDIEMTVMIRTYVGTSELQRVMRTIDIGVRDVGNNDVKTAEEAVFADEDLGSMVKVMDINITGANKATVIIP